MPSAVSRSLDQLLHAPILFRRCNTGACNPSAEAYAKELTAPDSRSELLDAGTIPALKNYTEGLVFNAPKPSRNAPCPCGSGKKYKRCHGASPSPLGSGKTLRPAHPVAEPSAATTLSIIICLLLALATVAIYAQTATHGYVAYDDDQYVYENHWVKAGLTASNVAWAFTTFFYANWHPLTWISYMLDFSLFGSNPGAQHLVNVAFHLASALLLFLALARMTRQPWRAALVAAIFAVHPLHVESVAWISERKDVLSTFFEMLDAPALRPLRRQSPASARYLRGGRWHSR